MQQYEDMMFYSSKAKQQNVAQVFGWIVYTAIAWTSWTNAGHDSAIFQY